MKKRTPRMIDLLPVDTVQEMIKGLYAGKPLLGV